MERSHRRIFPTMLSIAGCIWLLATLMLSDALRTTRLMSVVKPTSVVPRLQYTALFGKKDKGKFKGAPAPPSKAEKQGREDRFDAMTRKFMFTISGLTKALPDGSRTILKNINLCFYPGAKIGVVGLNGSGKSTLLKIMAGVEKSFDGTAVPMPGASVGYLSQEPTLEGATVMDNINLGVLKSQQVLDRFTELSTKCSEALPDDEMARVMDELAEVQNKVPSLAVPCLALPCLAVQCCAVPCHFLAFPSLITAISCLHLLHGISPDPLPLAHATLSSRTDRRRQSVGDRPREAARDGRAALPAARRRG